MKLPRVQREVINALWSGPRRLIRFKRTPTYNPTTGGCWEAVVIERGKRFGNTERTIFAPVLWKGSIAARVVWVGIRTLDSLEKKGLIERVDETTLSIYYGLTKPGRAAAKEASLKSV